MDQLSLVDASGDPARLSRLPSSPIGCDRNPRATSPVGPTTRVTFNLAKITLPTELQNAINKAQAAFAAGTQVQARVATADADANAQRQRGQDPPACAMIDARKAIPPNVTTFAPGSGFAITPGP